MKAAIDAMKPLQLHTWSSLPTGPCVEGEMAMIMTPPPATAPNIGVTISAKLVVCVATTSGPCQQIGTKPKTICVSSDAYCTQLGGTPANGSSANGIACTSSQASHACTGTTTYCAQFGGTYTTKWQQVSLSNPTFP